MGQEESTAKLIPLLLQAQEHGEAQSATLFFDPMGVCRHASSSAPSVLGVSQEQLLSRHFTALHKPGGLLPMQGERCCWEGGAALSETRHVDVRGELTLELEEVRGSAGELLGAMATYWRLPPMLTTRWEALLDRIPTGLLVVSDQALIRFANQAARRIMRHAGTWHRMEDAPLKIMTPRGEQLSREDHPLQRAVLRGEEVEGETLLFCFEDGTSLRVECSVLPLPDASQCSSNYLILLRDVSARHQREQQKGELLAIASHELRNPLTPLKGLLQMIEQEQGEGASETLRAHVQKAKGQVERLVKLVDGLLDLSIVETGRFSYSNREHDVRELLDELVASWSIRHGDERFDLELPSEPLLLTVDAAGIEQVLNNLVDNALKHNPAHLPIQIRLVREGEHALIEIQDRGEGFPMEQSEALFERFVQGRNIPKRRGSLGIGLYVSKRIIEEHAGTITLESQPGRGTRVAVRLPLR